MPFTFENVLGSFDLAALVEGMAEHRLVHRPGASAVPPGLLFSIEELEQHLLRDGMDRKDIRVTVNGRIQNLETVGIVKDQRLRPLVLRQLLQQGASIILNRLPRYDPKFAALARGAERALQERVDIAAVTSFSKLPALRAHYDAEDLIIVQVEGTKTWNFLGEPAECGIPRHPRIKVPTEVSATVTMRPGDVLLVPSGLHHQCVAEDLSLHLVFVIEQQTLPDFMADLWLEHPSLTRPLRASLGGGAVAEQAAALKADLIARIEQSDIADWLAERNGSRARITTLGLRPGSAAAPAGAVAELTTTMIPPLGAGRRWQVGGISFEPGAGAVAIVSALKAGPRPVRELLEAAERGTGAAEARAGLDQLADKGLVRIHAPVRDQDPAGAEESRAAE